MEWIRELPSQAGWYWVHFGRQGITCVEAIDWDGKLSIAGYTPKAWAIIFQAHAWYGPVFPPE